MPTGQKTTVLLCGEGSLPDPGSAEPRTYVKATESGGGCGRKGEGEERQRADACSALFPPAALMTASGSTDTFPTAGLT